VKQKGERRWSEAKDPKVTAGKQASKQKNKHKTCRAKSQTSHCSKRWAVGWSVYFSNAVHGAAQWSRVGGSCKRASAGEEEEEAEDEEEDAEGEGSGLELSISRMAAAEAYKKPVPRGPRKYLRPVPDRKWQRSALTSTCSWPTYQAKASKEAKQVRSARWG
jgi:hypothetical protein